MQHYQGAKWIEAPGIPPVLLLAADLISGGRWVYTYSVFPHGVVRLVVMPGPDMLPATDPAYAVVVHDLVRSME